MQSLISKRNFIILFALIFLQFIVFIIFPIEIKVWEDHDIAVNLVNDGEFYYESDGAKNHTFQFPVYSSALALGYFVLGIHLEWGIFLNILFHSLSFFLFVQLFGFIIHYFFFDIKEKYKNWIIYSAGFAFFFHPAILVYTLFHVHPLSLNIFTLFLGLYSSIRFAFYPTKKNTIIAGIVIGICMLDRATVLLTLVPAFLILIQKISFRDLVIKFSTIFLFILMIIAPWLIRNYNTDGIIGFESSAAKNIWKGVLYNSEGGNYLLNGETYYAALSEEEKLNLGKMSPIEQRDFFRMKYAEIWEKDPGHVLKMFLVKLKNFWWFRKHAGEEWGKLNSLLPIYKLIYALILILIVRLFYFQTKKIFILLSFPFALSLLQSYFYVEMRHRIAIEPFLLFIALVSLYYLIDQYLLQTKNNEQLHL